MNIARPSRPRGRLLDRASEAGPQMHLESVESPLDNRACPKLLPSSARNIA